MTYVIAFPCVDVKDKSCIEECPVDCIYEGDRMLYIQPDECVDCGACEPVCPVEAIFYEDDVPDEWSDYTAAKQLSRPGPRAGRQLGGQSFDAPLLANVPPRRRLIGGDRMTLRLSLPLGHARSACGARSGAPRRRC